MQLLKFLDSYYFNQFKSFSESDPSLSFSLFISLSIFPRIVLRRFIKNSKEEKFI